MKNPNGYGRVKHLSGSRKNPFDFVVADHGKQIILVAFWAPVIVKHALGNAIG